MEDDKTTITEEVVDTSTNEDADVDTDLEDMDVSFEDVEDDDETDDSEAETEDTEPTETEEESEEDEQLEEVATEEVEEPAEEPTQSEADTKKHNAEMAARRIADKQAREQAKQAEQQQYLEGYKEAYDVAIDSGFTEAQAEMEAQRELAVRQLRVDAYNNHVERNRNTLDSGIEKAVASIDLFREGTPEIKEELARRLEDFEAKFVRYDNTGEPVDIVVDPRTGQKADVYQYLQNEANSIRKLINTGARNQVKAKTKAQARTQTLPTRAPKEPTVDPDLAAFDEEAAKWE